MPTGLSSPQAEPVSAQAISLQPHAGLHTWQRQLSKRQEEEWRKPGPAMKPLRPWDRDQQAAGSSPPLQTPKSPTTNQLKAGT